VAAGQHRKSGRQAAGRPRTVRAAAADLARRDSDRETSAALATTGVQDGTTRLGSHAGAKAVGPLAANNGRLIGAFHDKAPEEKPSMRPKFQVSCQADPLSRRESRLWITRRLMVESGVFPCPRPTSCRGPLSVPSSASRQGAAQAAYRVRAHRCPSSGPPASNT
jgi:hypothetical protein